MSNTDREKVLFIVNPTSGKMTIKNKLFDVLKLFSNAGFESTVLMTEKSGDATKFAQKYAPYRLYSRGNDKRPRGYVEDTKNAHRGGKGDNSQPSPAQRRRKLQQYEIFQLYCIVRRIFKHILRYPPEYEKLPRSPCIYP